MYSDTQLSLAEFCAVMQGNPWMFAGIDRYGDVKTLSQEVNITLEDPWMTKASANTSRQAGSNSRTAVRDAIRASEQRFLSVTNIGINPSIQVWDTDHPVDSVYRTKHKGFVVRPRYHPIQGFGVIKQTQIGAKHTLTRTKDGVIHDIFSFTIDVPDNTSADEIHIYLTDDDGNYTGLPSLEHEIRPVSVDIDATGGAGDWQAHLSFPAYLAVLPDLYDNQRAPLPHSLNTYINEVVVYVHSLDICQQGSFVAHKQGQLSAAEVVSANFYALGHYYYQVEPIACQNETIRATVLKTYPKLIHINYRAGFERVNGHVDTRVADVISKLAIGYLSFDEERVNDRDVHAPSPLWTGKAQYYRERQLLEKRVDNIGAQVGREYASDVMDNIRYMLNGLEIRRGPVQAYGDILTYGWQSKEINRTIK